MPFNISRRGASDSGPRRTYRQPAMLIPGVLLAIICLAFVVAILIDDASHLTALLWPIAGLLVVWVIFLRPCVQLTQAGVVLRNLVRDVLFGWPAVDLIEQRWNLKVFDAKGHGRGSWAITAQRPRRASRRSFVPGGNIGKEDTDDLASAMRTRPGSAANVASAIRNAQLDYGSAVQRDSSVEAADEVVVQPAWPAIGALVLAVVCVVVAIAS
jgi:hypothetical protein